MGDPATGLLQERLVALTGQARVAAQMVRDGHPEGVHDLRVALRRLRSLLTTFARNVDGEVAALREAGLGLGTSRDAEVVHQRLAGLSTEHAELAGLAREPDRGEAIAFVGSTQWDQLVHALDRLAGRQVFADVTEPEAWSALERERRRLRRRVARADGARRGPDREGALHAVRKAAKRVRYAAEAMLPLAEGRLEPVRQVAEKVQESLGTHRDTRLAREWLLMHRAAGRPGSAADLLGGLAADEERAGDEALAAYLRLEPSLR